MFVINDNPPPLDPKLLARYEQFSANDIGHELDNGFVGTEIKALWRRQRVIGRAITLRTVGLDYTAAHRIVEMIEPSDVVVVDLGGERERTCWGVGLSKIAQERGGLGVVIDGPVTDVVEIEELRFPVWARGATPLTGRLLGLAGEINVPVQCGNAAVNPGDLIIGDDCGVIAMSSEMAWKYVPLLERYRVRSNDVRDGMRSGLTLPEASGANRLIDQAIRDTPQGQRTD